MNLADAAAQILHESHGEALTSREIAERAMARGLITPRSDTPWTYVAAAIRKENRQRRERGESIRFSSSGGRFELVLTA